MICDEYIRIYTGFPKTISYSDARSQAGWETPRFHVFNRVGTVISYPHPTQNPKEPSKPSKSPLIALIQDNRGTLPEG